jgi:hypothetical protein
MNWKYFLPCFCNIAPVFLYPEASNPFSFYPHHATKQSKTAQKRSSVPFCFLRQKIFFSDTMRKRVRLLNNFHKQCEKIVEKQRKFEQKKSPSDGYFV